VKRGEFYLVRKPATTDLRKRDPRKQRVFMVVSRPALIESRFTSLTCAPVYSQHDGLSTQVNVGSDEGLKKDSSVHCDELVSLPKSLLTNYVGSLKPSRLRELDQALAVAVGIENLELPA
jgi:mRNA interferase MazF